MKRALSLQGTILVAALLAGSASVSSALTSLPAPLKTAAESTQPSALIPTRAGRGGGFARGGGVDRGGGYARGAAVNRGPVVNRNTVVNRNKVVTRNTAVVRPGVRGAGARWARPANYWWRPGGAIVAGAAIGYVTAATAAAWAGAAPGPNMCWYYTDSTRTKGFWDACP